nr:putative ORF1 [Marmot picobirnavirus]
MTDIQVRYWANKESARHNLATEEQARNELVETNRHNVVGERETIRHNVAGERETKRHNVATEGETKRHNVRTEGQTDRQLSENKRHNVVTENLTKRDIANKERKTTSDIQLNKAKAAESNARAKNINWENQFRDDNPTLAQALYAAKSDKSIAKVLMGAGLTEQAAKSVAEGLSGIQGSGRIGEILGRISEDVDTFFGSGSNDTERKAKRAHENVQDQKNMLKGWVKKFSGLLRKVPRIDSRGASLLGN